MGRPRFLIYPWFINRAAMGRARFLIYPWFINRAAMDRARFLICTWFIFFNRAAQPRSQGFSLEAGWGDVGPHFKPLGTTKVCSLHFYKSDIKKGIGG